MVCKLCGHEMLDGETVCPVCGWDSDVEKVKNESDKAVEESKTETTSSYDSSFNSNGASEGTVFTAPNTSYVQPEPADNSSKFALASLICGIVGLLCCCIGSIAGVVLGIFGLKSKDKKNLAIAGLIVSGAGIILKIILIITVLVGSFFVGFSQGMNGSYESDFFDYFEDFGDNSGYNYYYND